MQRKGIISTENLYEIKAPLATFDTIDLGDEQINYPSQPSIVSVSHQRSPAESEGSVSGSNSPATDSLQETTTPPTAEADVKLDSNGATAATAATCATETDIKSTENDSENKLTNSSENNASAEEIQFRLKLKGKKYKTSATKVKYEHFESASDISDQEKLSPMPTLRLGSQHKLYDSDTDSSDSDSGYIRSDYISATKGVVVKHDSQRRQKKSVSGERKYSGSDSTPNSSPKVIRPILPLPLSKEESASRSKRKAYEKRLQRLKVTTNPIERPRSTTPINIYGLDEYVSFSSPEKSPQNTHQEKLKIKLPLEEFQKSQSVRRNSKSKDSPEVFDFNEELLFTHTRSAIILQGDSSTGIQSPKRILVPLTLSPNLSPHPSPKHKHLHSQDTSKYSPQYIYTPSESLDTGKDICEKPISSRSVDENWATFDEPVTGCKPENTHNNFVDESANSDVVPTSVEKEIGSSIKETYDKLNREELIIVNIDETGDKKICDIRCADANDQENCISSELSDKTYFNMMDSNISESLEIKENQDNEVESESKIKSDVTGAELVQ